MGRQYYYADLVLCKTSRKYYAPGVRLIPLSNVRTHPCRCVPGGRSRAIQSAQKLSALLSLPLLPFLVLLAEEPLWTTFIQQVPPQDPFIPRRLLLPQKCLDVDMGLSWVALLQTLLCENPICYTTDRKKEVQDDWGWVRRCVLKIEQIVICRPGDEAGERRD